jgi:hypothetical protein
MPLQEPLDVISDFARRMERARIAFMITGSVAGQFYGLNRSTADTDVVIDARPGDARSLVEAFAQGWFVDAEMVRESLAKRWMFNILPMAGGKFDLIPLGPTAFDREAFGRRVATTWHDTPVWVPTPQDLVLSKLRWARETHSALQFRDIREIMARSHFDEHDAYFQRWLRQLDLAPTLDAAFAGGH